SSSTSSSLSFFYTLSLHDALPIYLHNPKDGYPFENGLAGVTIISDKSIDGDALSTLVFSKGLADGMAFVESLDDVEAIFITKDKDRKSTRLNSSHVKISYAVFCLK